MSRRCSAGIRCTADLVSLRIFLDHCRRHRFLLLLRADARLYQEDMSNHGEELPRFVPEIVMPRSCPSPTWTVLPDDTTRHFVVVLIETALHASDACNEPLDAIIDGSVGKPCLPFFNSKDGRRPSIRCRPVRPKPSCSIQLPCPAV